MSKYILLLLSAIFLVSCVNEKKDTVKNEIVFSDFPKNENITFENFIKFDYGAISRMFLTDTTLIVYDWRARNGYFFYEYGLNSKLNTGKHIPHGRSKGQALGALSAGLFKNTLWMYDISLSKIIFSDLNTKALSVDSTTTKEYPFSPKYYNIDFLDSVRLIANGNYQTPKNIQEVNLNSGKIITEYGLITNIPKDIPLYAWKRANEGLLVLKPTNDKVVLANRLNDQLEIFDVESQNSITMKGPENFAVEFTSFKSNDGMDMVGRNEKSRYGFVRAAATNEFIYLLFSGNNRSSQYIDYGKTLYVYDWNGKPIRKITFDRYICGFVVSDDNETLYAHDVSTKFIVRTKI